LKYVEKKEIVMLLNKLYVFYV